MKNFLNNYVGSTKDLKDRLNRHNTGRSKFTSKGIPWVLIHTLTFETRKEAVQLELKIKKRGIRRFLEDKNIE